MLVFKNKPDLTTPITAENLNHNFNELNNKIGEVVESGSNNYGNYIKFSDGTMICYRKATATIDCSIPWGSLYAGMDATKWYFAQEFTEVPTVELSLHTKSSASAFLINYSPPEITTESIRILGVARPTVGTNVQAEFHIFAIGKWK